MGCVYDGGCLGYGGGGVGDCLCDIEVYDFDVVFVGEYDVSWFDVVVDNVGGVGVV